MSEDKQLLNIVRIYLDNPNDIDMERTLERYSNKNNTVKLYHKIKDLERQLDEIKKLLWKCKDTIQASLAEEGISDMRRSYREDLYKLIENELKEQGDE